jgi:hypothetical protein
MHLRHAVLIAAAFLMGCAQQRVVISRFDGLSINPVTQEQAATECGAKAQVASAGVPYQPLGDSYGIGRAMEQAGVQRSAFQACMAEKGMRVAWVQEQQETASIPSRQLPSGVFCGVA